MVIPRMARLLERLLGTAVLFFVTLDGILVQGRNTKERNATKRGRHCESPALAAAVLVTNSVADPGRALAPAPRLGEQVVAIEIHDLVPGSHEVTHELLLRVVTRVDLRQRSELRVRAEHEIGGCGAALQLARG